MIWEPTQDAIDRFNRKASLGQARVVVTSAEEKLLNLEYQRFDSDTGTRIADEVQLVKRNEIAAQRDAATAELNALTMRVQQLNSVVAYLDGILGI